MKRLAILLVAVASVAGMAASWTPASGPADRISSTEFSFMNTVRAEEHLTATLLPEKSARLATAADSHPPRADEGRLPELDGAIGWLNSAPLDRKSLRGKVVLVDIWTYSCINSLRQLP